MSNNWKKELKYAIRDSFKSLKRNSWMSVIAIASVTLMLTLISLFATLVLNTQKITRDIEHNVKISVYMNLNTNDYDKEIEVETEQGKSKQVNPDYKKIYNQIKSIDTVEKITYSSKDEQLEQLIKIKGDVWKVFNADENPLHNVYIVTVNDSKNMKGTAVAISKIKGVSTVDFGGKTSTNLFAFNNTVNFWGFVTIVALLVVAVFLISNTIRLAIIARSEEITIMRLVGAKNSHIKAPFILEGLWLGALGAIIPSIILTVLYHLFYNSYSDILATQNLSLYGKGAFITSMTFALILFGSLIGGSGSWLAIRKYLKV